MKPWRVLAPLVGGLLLFAGSPVAAAGRPDWERLAASPRRSVLDNGLTLLVREDHAAPLVAIQAWIGSGAHDGQPGGGLAHWAEHMIFKGSAARPPGRLTAEIDAGGGAINAYTTGDRTVFWVEMPAAGWRTGLEILADALLRAAFPATECQREREVVRREMAMERDSPDRRVARLLWSTAYRVHPARFPVIGEPELFDRLERRDLLDFFQRHYRPGQTILVMAGAAPAAEMEAAAREFFGPWPRGTAADGRRPAEPPADAPRSARQTGPYAVTRLALAWHTVAASHPDAPLLDLLAAAAGGGRSARLVSELQEKRRLAVEIGAWSFTPRDPGLFGISAVCEPEREAELLAALAAEIQLWRRQPFSRAAVERARRGMLVGQLLEFQDLAGQARNFAAGEFYHGHPLFFREYLRRLEAATPADLQAVARQYLRDENRSTAILAPGQEAEEGRRKKAEGGRWRVES